MPLASYIYKWF